MLRFSGDQTEATVTTTPASGTPPLADATVAQIAGSGITRAFPKSTVLIHDGDVGDALYIILSGRVKVYARKARRSSSTSMAPANTSAR